MHTVNKYVMYLLLCIYKHKKELNTTCVIVVLCTKTELIPRFHAVYWHVQRRLFKVINVQLASYMCNIFVITNRKIFVITNGNFLVKSSLQL